MKRGEFSFDSQLARLLHFLVWQSRGYNDSLSPLRPGVTRQDGLSWMLSSGYLCNAVHRHLGYNDTTVPLHTLFTGLVNLFECFRLELCPDLTNCTFNPNSVNVGLS